MAKFFRKVCTFGISWPTGNMLDYKSSQKKETAVESDPVQFCKSKVWREILSLRLISNR